MSGTNESGARKMIATSPYFQRSVNIAYDLNDKSMADGFIPTDSALRLFEEILLSVESKSTKRARILIGAYGKGKSRMTLAILRALLGRDMGGAVHLQKALEKKENEKLRALLESYRASGKKILPVLVSGTSDSLSQSFMVSLRRALEENDLRDVMPETNYSAAAKVIKRWKNEWPETLAKFESLAEESAESFLRRLDGCDISAYKKFTSCYFEISSGGIFDPFLGLDVTELYESAARALKLRGWSGLYVVYDEFGKYLEANIARTSAGDMKMLQDFAEKCARSDDPQMHIMLICHKEIENYIDILPKQKVDGWRGISERFERVCINNDFAQIYSVIAQAIEKDETLWKKFSSANEARFENLAERYSGRSAFKEFSKKALENIFKSCYPLHPVTLFALPRLSERIAQNERTLFTFLASDGACALCDFLRSHDEKIFSLVTLDFLWDYFEPLLQKDFSDDGARKNYLLAKRIFETIDGATELERKIVKALSLIFILAQFDALPPTRETILEIFDSDECPREKIIGAIDSLECEWRVVYPRASDSRLALKETSEIDIREKIENEIEKQRPFFSLKNVLNEFNGERFIYPSRHNDEKEITRWFNVVFIDADEIFDGMDWDKKSEGENSDGAAFAVLARNESALKKAKSAIKNSPSGERAIAIAPNHFETIEKTAREWSAAARLKEKFHDDKIFCDECEIAMDDAREALDSFVKKFTRPENGASSYFHKGENKKITRRKELSELLSKICDRAFAKSPVIKNEAVNKNEITATAFNSRSKVISALLDSPPRENLRLSKNGQEVSIMRGALLRPGVLKNENGCASIKTALGAEDNLKNGGANLNPLLREIKNFMARARKDGGENFGSLYKALSNPPIGARKGIIPIYMAAVFSANKKEIAIYSGGEQLPLNARTIERIDKDCENFSLAFMDWDEGKEKYVRALKKYFARFASQDEGDPCESAAQAMRSWYLSLPRCAKEYRQTADESGGADKARFDFLKALKQNYGERDLLFSKLPAIFGCGDSFGEPLAREILDSKKFFDGALGRLQERLSRELKKIFSKKIPAQKLKKIPLASVTTIWLEGLDKKISGQVFADGADKCLEIFSRPPNDEGEFLRALAKAGASLRLEDWDEKTADEFLSRMAAFKKTAESFHSKNARDEDVFYEISFGAEKNSRVTKRFGKVVGSARGKLLRNKILDALESIGLAVSQAEKRQILAEILRETV